jgi:hypothetical protein
LSLSLEARKQARSLIDLAFLAKDTNFTDRIVARRAKLESQRLNAKEFQRSCMVKEAANKKLQDNAVKAPTVKAKTKAEVKVESAQFSLIELEAALHKWPIQLRQAKDKIQPALWGSCSIFCAKLLTNSSSSPAYYTK